MRDLISAYEAATILGVTPPTVYQWVPRGLLGAHRDQLTRRLYLQRQEVQALAPERRIQLERESDQPTRTR